MVPRGLFSSPLGFLFLPSGFPWPPSLPLGRGIQLRYPATLTEIGHPHHTVMGQVGRGTQHCQPQSQHSFSLVCLSLGRAPPIPEVISKCMLSR